jgi:LacI family transcriptional regulator
MAVSVREVAALAGVSLGTVSNVLNRPDKVAPTTVDRVQSAIATLGFVRNDSARQLRAGRSSTVGLIVLDGGNPFFTDVARGAEDAAMDKGLAVLIGNSDESTDRERTYVDLFEERRVAGLLISPAGDDLSRLARLRDQGTAVVLVDRRADDEHFASVSVDDVAGGRIAVEHLAATGRTRIAFVGGPSSIRQVADRHAGALSAARAAGIGLESAKHSRHGRAPNGRTRSSRRTTCWRWASNRRSSCGARSRCRRRSRSWATTTSPSPKQPSSR